jgi:oxygen-independent coproporphyrinogen-3 oxidase
LEPLNKPGDAHRSSVSAYIHIPFCIRRCPYCAFFSVAGASRECQERYLDALERELDARAQSEAAVQTLYVGGGTPTVPDDPLLARIMRMLRARFAVSAVGEVSVEALPGTLSEEKAGILAAAGVNRVTLGVQSLEKEVLAGIGRSAEYEALPQALSALRQAGISNIGIDIIIGLPGETREGFYRGLEDILRMGCAHVSAYFLSIEKGTPFARSGERGLRAPDWALRRNYTALCSFLRRAGFEHYEVSNFALPGYACRHNLATWRGESLLGFGAGAVGTVYGQPLSGQYSPAVYGPPPLENHSAVYDAEDKPHAVRRHNTPSLEAYLAKPEDAYTEEILDEYNLFNERLLLGLRTREGFAAACGLPPLENYSVAHGVSPEALREKLDGFAAARLLRCGHGRYSPTLRGMLYLDSLLVDLFADGCDMDGVIF